MVNELDDCMFLIHLLACFYGSMYKHQLADFQLMIAFSILNESLGNPLFNHVIEISFKPNTFKMLYSLVLPTYYSSRYENHSFIKSDLNLYVKGPKQAMIPDDTNISPIRLLYSRDKVSHFCCHFDILSFKPSIMLVNLLNLVSTENNYPSKFSCSSILFSGI